VHASTFPIFFLKAEKYFIVFTDCVVFIHLSIPPG
jgi:hypothetical protein